MSLLGKILAFLNILGVSGFIALASMTYAKRHAWETANFRHDLAVWGVPVDDTDSDKAGVPLIDKFGADDESRKDDATLKELFPGTPGPVVTQVEEVERVNKELRSKLEEAGDNLRQQNIFLARFLLALGGRQPLPEIYVDREFYLSMQAQLADDAKFAAFKKALSDALPIAVDAMRFDPKKLSFEKQFQQALAGLPGDDKRKLAEAFLAKLPRGGTTFEAAAEAGKAVAEDVEKKGEAKVEAEAALDKAKAAVFVATAEFKANPTPDNEMKLKQLKEARQAAEQAAEQTIAAAKLLPDAREAGAVAFLQTIRKGDKRNDKKLTDYIKDVVEEVVKEMIEATHAELNDRYEKAYTDAAKGVYPAADSATNQLLRDERRLAIARFLLAGIEVTDEKALGQQDLKIADLQLYRRFFAVVGIEWAVKAVNAQQQGLVEIVNDLNSNIAREQAIFREDHQNKLVALRRRAEAIDRLAQRLQEIADQANTQATISKGEVERVNQYVEDLKDSRGLTAKEMETLTKLTEGLNKVRIGIRDAINRNQANLRKITQMEEDILYYQEKLAAKDKAEKDKKKKKTTTP